MTYYESIRTRDDHTLGITVFEPPESSDKVVIIGPCTGLSQNRYAALAAYLQQNGCTVLTFDYRGTGRSAPTSLKGFSANIHIWASQDADAVIRFAKNSYSGQELIFLGHGLSGELFGLIPASQYINRLVLVGSALSCTRMLPFRDRIRLKFFHSFARMLTNMFGYFPGEKIGIMQNLPAGVMKEWARWCNCREGLFEEFPERKYRKIELPLLCLSFEEDWLSPPAAVASLLDYYSGSTSSWHQIRAKEIGVDRVGHKSFLDLPAGLKIWPMIIEWMN